MKFFQRVYTKIKDYFTANTGRKIFFYGLLLTIFGFVLSIYFQFFLVRTAAMVGLVVAGFGTLWDSMYTRYLFLQKIRDIQYQHLKEVYDQQAAGEGVEMTPTFSDEEKRYLRRRKWGFFFVIVFKTFLLLALFSLLLTM